MQRMEYDNRKPGDLKIEHWKPTEDGELNKVNLEKKLQKQGYDFTRYEFPPGMNFPDHTHAISKKDSILKGKMQFSMYGQTVVLGPGDMIQVPKDTIHNATVIGREFVTFYDGTKNPNQELISNTNVE